MVAESLFADTLHSSWPERARRGWTTLTSFGLQALFAAVLIVLPLLRPSGLPSLRQLSTPISLGRPQPESRVASGDPHPRFASPHPVEFFFRRPSPLPTGPRPVPDDGPPQIQESGPYIPGVGASGDTRGVSNLLGEGSRPVLPVPPPAAVARPLQVSHISEGNLIRRVQPAYPALARSARIQGVVVLQAVIGKQGNIENLRLISGHPMLAPAAIDAVRQWRYRPYILNNDPIEVETQITVNFALAGN
jgi:protein TonB